MYGKNDYYNCYMCSCKIAYKENFVILQSIGIIIIEIEETRVVIYICRYLVDNLIPNSVH